MPLYEYACDACDHAFEALVFEGESDAVECPECASTTVTKQLSVPAVGAASLPVSSCGEGPPCGAPYCRRKG